MPMISKNALRPRIDTRASYQVKSSTKAHHAYAENWQLAIALEAAWRFSAFNVAIDQRAARGIAASITIHYWYRNIKFRCLKEK